MKRIPLSILLSFNDGYLDTAGFLALQGLFPAHVTGNFVTLGATLVIGGSGALPKLLALPVFCVVILVTCGASALGEPNRTDLLEIGGQLDEGRRPQGSIPQGAIFT